MLPQIQNAPVTRGWSHTPVVSQALSGRITTAVAPGGPQDSRIAFYTVLCFSAVFNYFKQGYSVFLGKRVRLVYLPEDLC